MKRSSSPYTLAALSLVCILILGACCSTSVPVLRYITISPQSQSTTVGTSVTFTATAYYSDGSQAPGSGLVSWGSTNPAVATVVGGVVNPLTAGTTTITATAAGTPGATASLTVTSAATLTGVTVTPVTQTVPLGGSQPYDAMANYSDGTSQDVTTTSAWTSSNTAAATIGASTGLAAVPTGATVGATSTISATYNGMTGTATLTVGAAVAVSLQITTIPATPSIGIGNTVSLLAQEVYSDSTLHIPANVVQWSNGTPATANLHILTANNSETSVALGLASGSTLIAATDGALTASVTVTVAPVTAKYAYVSNSGDTPGDIQWYSVSTTTSPYLTSQGTFQTGVPAGSVNPYQTAIHPTGQYLYYTDSGNNVWVTTVNPSTGALTATSYSAQPGGFAGDNVLMAVDPYGRFLYVADDGATSGTSAITGFTISQNGANAGSLTPITGMSTSSPFTTNLNTPEGFVIDPTGSYLYATNSLANTVSAYSIDQNTGALTPLSPATYATGSTPWYCAFDPSGTHLYAADQGDGTVAGFTMTQGTGALTEIGTTPFTLTPTPYALWNLVVDPSGTHIYVLDSGNTTVSSQIYGFSIGSGGAIGAAISGTPIAAGVVPFTSIVIDPTGSLLAVGNTQGNNISVFTVGSGGVLTPSTGGPVGTGSGPTFVTFYNAP